MRKRNKVKRHSCPLCKPHKTGHVCRWTGRDLARLKTWAKDKEKLFQGITPENINRDDEWLNMPPVGREIISD